MATTLSLLRCVKYRNRVHLDLMDFAFERKYIYPFFINSFWSKHLLQIPSPLNTKCVNILLWSRMLCWQRGIWHAQYRLSILTKPIYQWDAFCDWHLKLTIFTECQFTQACLWVPKSMFHLLYAFVPLDYRCQIYIQDRTYYALSCMQFKL